MDRYHESSVEPGGGWGGVKKLLPQLPQLLEFVRYVGPKWRVSLCNASSLSTQTGDHELSVRDGGGESCCPNCLNELYV